MKKHTAPYRQRGYNLYLVALISMVFAAVAMAALWSFRYERNVFAEGLAKVGKMFNDSPAQGMVDSAKNAVADATAPAGTVKSDGKLRKCIIDGKAVISNADCLDSNPTSKVIKIQETRGVEAPKVPPKPKEEATSMPALDKAIEKQLR